MTMTMKVDTMSACMDGSPRIDRWRRIEAFAVGVLAGFGLLRAWYAVAEFSLRHVLPSSLAARLGRMRSAVVVPSRTGGGVIPLRDGRTLGRGQCFGGQVHDEAECARRGRDIMHVRVPRRKYALGFGGHPTILCTVGWRQIRSER